MISYSQNYEDVILDRAFGSKATGFYVDVGAASPNEATVTRHFYELGWHGINIEPIPEWAAELSANRPRDLNLAVAAGATHGTFTLYRVVDDPSLSTLSAEVARDHESEGREIAATEVSVLTLDEILADAGGGEIDFLKIDVEGAERDVLLGIDLDRTRPRVIVVEAVEPYSFTPTYETFESLITDHRYLYASTDGINRYYVREEDRKLMPLLVPANAVDGYTPMRERLLEDEITRLRIYVRGLERVVSERESGGSDPTSSARRPTEARRAAPTLPRRVAVLSAPCSGGGSLTRVVAAMLHATAFSADHPADIHWDAVPERAVLNLSWERTERLAASLQLAGFTPLTVARHPFDLLIAILRVARVDRTTGRWLDDRGGDESAIAGEAPTSGTFLEWATGPRGRALVGITRSWWDDPATLRICHDDIAEPTKVMAVFDRFEPLDVVLDDRGGAIGGMHSIDIEAVPGSWRRYLTPVAAETLDKVYRTTIAELGCSPTRLEGLPDQLSALANWATIDTVRPI
jgi:FkbM family methyltransferase